MSWDCARTAVVEGRVKETVRQTGTRWQHQTVIDAECAMQWQWQDEMEDELDGVEQQDRVTQW